LAANELFLILLAIGVAAESSAIAEDLADTQWDYCIRAGAGLRLDSYHSASSTRFHSPSLS
jgi:hypothetical protein